jgi:hypothetical protein
MSIISLGTKIVDLRRAVGSSGSSGGGGLDPAAFVTEWEVASGDTIMLGNYVTWQATTNNYDVDWGDGSSDSNVTSNDKTHTYTFLGGGTKVFQVVITGQLDSLNMYRTDIKASYPDNATSLIKMVQWGTDSKWRTLSNTFRGCTNLEYTATDAPDLSAVSGYGALDGSYIFNACSQIVSLDLSNWTTPLFTTIGGLAGGAISLELLDITGWNTANVVSIGAFAAIVGTATVGGCELKAPDLTFNLSYINYVFNNSKFSSMDLSNWDIGPTPKDGTAMFSQVDGEFALDLSSWTNTGSIRAMSSVFNTSEFSSINLTGWNTSNATTFISMFSSCLNLTEVIGLSSLRATESESLKNMFYNCVKMSFDTHDFSNQFGVDLGAAGKTSVNLSGVFHLCSSAVSSSAPNLQQWDTSLVTNMGNMFFDASWNTSIHVWDWDTSNVVGGVLWASGMKMMFRNFEGTTNFNFGKWDFSGIDDWQYFLSLSDATTIDLGSGQDFSSTTIWTNSFAGLGNISVNFLGTANIPATILNNCFLSSTLLTSQYDALLEALDTTSGSNGSLGGGDSNFSLAPAPGGNARASLIAKGWTIADDGGI